MQSKRFIVTAVSIVLLAVAVGTSLYFGFLNNQSNAGSNASIDTPAAFYFLGGLPMIALTDADGSAFDITAKFESDDGSNDATLIGRMSRRP